MLHGKHPFSDDLDLIILFKEDGTYASLVDRFQASHAFLVRGTDKLPTKPTVLVDGEVVEQDWFTQDHLDVILAHELAHHLLGEDHGSHHAAGGNPDVCQTQEREADWVAFRILARLGKDGAAELLAREFEARYGHRVFQAHDLPRKEHVHAALVA